MSLKRPSLQDVPQINPQDLARCTGYVWHLETRIGKGAFGDVYFGWANDGKEEVAVKTVSKSYFRQDPKVRENLEREVRIMKLLRNCEYVVRLRHVQDMKQHLVLVMEMCDYDLDYLVRKSPFREDDVTLLLFQLAQGMKVLREHNIVHRNLKPGNIFIKKDVVTGKMKIKIADFGFARHFAEEGTKKPLDMSSLAGTPVYMAPEALMCLFYPGEHYDDKVDMWSIGALLYKVIVGATGFYAQLQDIPKILKRKKDAIAFERVPGTQKIKYICELPAHVHDRLSPEYRAKMNSLLVHQLKLDPQERMSFPEFFEFVDDLVSFKIEVVNLLQGTSEKIIYDTSMTLDRLQTEVHAQLGVAVAQQLLFFLHASHCISPHTHLSPNQFAQLMEKCGATKGNGLLYLLPISDVQNSEGSPDDSCLAQLKFAVADETKCVELIKEYKYTNEIVCAVNLLQSQQKRQLSGLEEFSEFCAREIETFKSQFEYQEVYARGLKASASASLAADWLGADLDGLPKAVPTEQAQGVLKTLQQLKVDVNKLVPELDTLYHSSKEKLKSTEQGGKPNIDTSQLAELTEHAKKLPELGEVEMFVRCQMILRRCNELIRQTWGIAHQELHVLWSSLSTVWTLNEKSKHLHEVCSQLDDILTKTIPQVRSNLLSSLCSGVAKDRTRLSTTSRTRGSETSTGFFRDKPPYITQLLEYPQDDGTINIIEQIGGHYKMLGPLLLDDDTGAIIDNIEKQCQKDVFDINFEVLRRWLRGNGITPVTWETLIGKLKSVRLTQLARTIEDSLQ